MGAELLELPGLGEVGRPGLHLWGEEIVGCRVVFLSVDLLTGDRDIHRDLRGIVGERKVDGSCGGPPHVRRRASAGGAKGPNCARSFRSATGEIGTSIPILRPERPLRECSEPDARRRMVIEVDPALTWFSPRTGPFGLPIVYRAIFLASTYQDPEAPKGRSTLPEIESARKGVKKRF